MGNIDSDQKTEEEEKDPTILDEDDTEYLELKTGLTRDEIESWHHRFLVLIIKYIELNKITTNSYYFPFPGRTTRWHFKTRQVY